MLIFVQYWIANSKTILFLQVLTLKRHLLNRREYYKRNFVFKKSKLVLNLLMVHYFNLDHNKIRILESAAFSLYLDSTQNTSVNQTIRLLLSLLCWTKVILLSCGHYIKTFKRNKDFFKTKFFYKIATSTQQSACKWAKNFQCQKICPRGRKKKLKQEWRLHSDMDFRDWALSLSFLYFLSFLAWDKKQLFGETKKKLFIARR